MIKGKKENVLKKHSMAILYNAFSIVLILLIFTSSFSCKHKKNEIVYVTLTIEGGEHITLKNANPLKIESGSEWRNIEKTAREKIEKVDDGWELFAFHLKSGEVLKAEHKFSQDAVIVAIAKKQMVTAQIVADSGYNPTKETSFEFPKYSFWKDIKENAKTIATLNEDYDALDWRKDSTTGDVITDETKFDKDVKIFALSKIKPEKDPKNVVITIMGNSYVEITDGKLIEDKNVSWKAIKEKVEKKIRIKENCYLFEWRENSENGDLLQETKIFSEHTTIFAIGKEKTVNIRIDADEGYEKDFSLINIEVQSGSLWKDIKEKAEKAVKIKTDYFKDVWKLENIYGEKIAEDYAFTKDSYTVFATSKKKIITIIVAKDEGYDFVNNTPIEVSNSVKWGFVLNEAKARVMLKDGYESSVWKLRNENGIELKDDYVFFGDETVFATSNAKTFSYTVEHKKESLDDPNKYDIFKTETKMGKAYQMTDARALVHKGFEAKKIEQKKLFPNTTIVVEVKYNRREIKLILDLKGGTLQTTNGKYHLKGKFGKSVKVEQPRRKGFLFERWQPSLPDTFKVEDEGRVYSAIWMPVFEIKVVGDERYEVVDDDPYTVPKNGVAVTLGSIKENLKAKLKLRREWDRSDEKDFYGFYAFRLDGETGRILDDGEVINQDMTVYAQSNFLKFRVDLQGRLSCETVNGRRARPRGNIVLPLEAKKIVQGAFYACRNLYLVDASLCKDLEVIERNSFERCTGATIKLPSNVSTIQDYAFGSRDGKYCRCVAVPNSTVRMLVKTSKYPEQHIVYY